MNSDGTFTGYYQLGSGDDAESCAMTGTLVQPDPQRHVLQFSGTVSANGTATTDNTTNEKGFR